MPPLPALSLSFSPLPGHIFVFKHKTGGVMVRAMAGGQVPGPGAGPGARGEAVLEVLALRNLVAV